jgi:hypothetical protein
MNSNQIIRSKVEYLVNLINEQRPGFIDYFKSDSSVEKIYEAIPIQIIPEGLIEIYSYIRGVSRFERSDINSFDLIPDYELFSLNEISNMMKILRDSYSKRPSLDDWKLDMIPFLRNCRSDFYCIRSLDNDQSIHLIYRDDMGFSVYQDIEHFLDVSISCYLQKAYFLDEEGYLICNDELKNKIYYEGAISRGIKPNEIQYPC